KVIANACWVRNWQPNVFIQMKHLHALPVDIRSLGQSIQEFKLRGPGCSNNSRCALFRDGIPDNCRRLLSRGTGERNFALEDFDNHLIAGANSYWIKCKRKRASLCPLKGMRSTPALSVSAVVLHRWTP